jgi:hypothetical protein
MEILFSQRYNYASIRPLKDYCRLDEKKRSTNTFDVEENFEEFDNLFKPITIKETTHSIFPMEILTLPEKLIKGKRRTFYFYNNGSIGERIPLYSPNKKITTFYTDKDRHIKAHYGNPYSQIEVNTHERSITRNGDRITIKNYHHSKTRKFNSIYFRKKTTVNSLTFDLKTGNFLTLFMNKYKKGNSKQFRTNSFQSLEFFIHQIMPSAYITEEKKIFNDYDDSVFVKKISEVLNLNNEITFDKLDIISKFVELKKIKVPNDYYNLLTTHYPTEKFLKKNDRKLIASILDAIGIKSKITIKIVHDNLDIDMGTLHWLCTLLGDEYPKFIGNINGDIFKKINGSQPRYAGLKYEKPLYSLKGRDREMICTILNDFVVNGKEYEKKDKSFLRNIEDHLNMMDRIRPYDSNIRINAKTWRDFNIEHTEFTKIISMIRKGWVTEYVFNKKMIEDIEKPITIELNIGDEETPNIVKETFYPFILKREDDYSEEGSFMHHCVATYSDKDKSIIISVRTENANDRVTCEFTTQTGEMVQARHFCNKQPPADIELAIDELKVKTLKYARLGLLNCLEKKKTQVKINGIEVPKPPMIPTLNEHLFNYEVPF